MSKGLALLKENSHLEPSMAAKPVAPAKPVVARRKANDGKKLTSSDVRIAARGGDEAFAYYVENGKLPVSK